MTAKREVRPVDELEAEVLPARDGLLLAPPWPGMTGLVVTEVPALLRGMESLGSIVFLLAALRAAELIGGAEGPFCSATTLLSKVDESW